MDNIEVQRLKHKISYFKTEIRLLKKLLKENPRELSDEEFEEMCEMMADMYNDWHQRWSGSRGYSEQCDIMGMILKAILKKASEK